MDPLPITIIPSPELMAAIWIIVGICVVACLIMVYVELHTLNKSEKEEVIELQDPDPHGFTSSAETEPLRVVRRKK
jgi:hypothetical protein